MHCTVGHGTFEFLEAVLYEGSRVDIAYLKGHTLIIIIIIIIVFGGPGRYCVPTWSSI